MKPILFILRYLMTWDISTPVTYYLGLFMLPLVFVIGMVWPRLGFGLAIWNFLLLLAIPLFTLPISIRTLLSNQRLALMPGFARKVIVALFIQIVLTASFLPFFAWLFDIQRFPALAAYYLFIGISLYLLVAFILARTQWGIMALGILMAPAVIMVNRWAFMRGELSLLGTTQLYTLILLVILGWLLVLRLASKTRTVHPAAHNWNRNDQVYGVDAMLKMGLLPNSGNSRSPALSLLLGYPANTLSVLRLKLLAGLLGPLPIVLFIRLADINQVRFSWADLLRMVMFIYLFSAAFMGFQNAELVTRMRLLWLKAPRLRNDLWGLLETQHWLSQATFLFLTILLTVAATFLLSIKPQMLLHYPLLLLVLNANTSYYCMCARLKGWSRLRGFILIAATWFFSVWIAAESMRLGIGTYLIALEVVLVGFAIGWRHLAKTHFARVDWQVLKPARAVRGVSI
ncbi:MAG: hypothetical protein V4628_05840 [Pseudomonadota bacterium]